MTTNNKKYAFVLLAILLLGFLIRIYNINFPAIGYHNMKENDFLSIAQEMQRTQDYVTRRTYFLEPFKETPQMRLVPQPPLISYQILFLWKFLGQNLWGPRLLNVIFGVSSILIFYFIALMLFADQRLSLFSAFLLAIMPLAVFFSRNIQPESPALFFMLLGNLFYLKFITSLKKRDLFFGGLAFLIAGFYKLTFFVGIAPFLFCLPFKTLLKSKERFLKSIAAFLLPYLIFLLIYLWLKNLGQMEFQQFDKINLFEIFTRGYWQENKRMIWWYVQGENFTIVYTILTALGILIAFSRRKGLLNRYIIGWTVAAIPYCALLSFFIKQHNYYQMPFLALFCISSVYSVGYICEKLKKTRIAEGIILTFLIVTVVGASAVFVHGSIIRMYGTVFLGADVAGESLKEYTKPGDRIFLLSHSQGLASISRYARRYAGWTDNLEEFKRVERQFAIGYICFFPGEYVLGLKARSPELFAYIQKNYQIKEVGLTMDPVNKLHYIILNRGSGFDAEKFFESFSGVRRLRTIYKIFKSYVFFYTLHPQQEKKEPSP